MCSFWQVDDLDDITRLEEYIDATQVVMILLHGCTAYFQSTNCLREVRTAVAKAKPVVLLRDGVELDTARQICPEELRGVVFDTPHAVIEWHRLGDFQVITLLQICRTILPAAVAPAELALDAVPGARHVPGPHFLQSPWTSPWALPLPVSSL